MATLKAFLEALPAELYNEIFKLTFITNGKVHKMDSSYKPPSSLHVSRDSRAAFAKSYYGEGIHGNRCYRSIFYISSQDCSRWIGSLAQNHVDMLEEVRVTGDPVVLDTATILQLRNEWNRDGDRFSRSMTDRIGGRNVLDVSIVSILVKHASTNEEKWKTMTELAQGSW